MKYTNYFLNKKEYNESICDQVQDSLNYYKETKEFYFFDENENKTESYIIATYNVSSTSNTTKLLDSAFKLSQIIEMYVDDIKLDNVVSAYTFNTIGEHEIKFKCNKCIQQITNCNKMFYNCSGLTSIEFSDNFDTSNVTDMSYMFCGCSALTSLDVSSFDTSNVTNMENMFNVYNYYGNKLTSITFSDKFDTSNVTDMSYMFNGCYRLTSLDVSNFNTSKVIDMDSMFYYCSKLTSLDLTSFNTSKVTNMSNMFYMAHNITNLNLSGFDTSNVTNFNSFMYYAYKIKEVNMANATFNDNIITNSQFIFYYVPTTTHFVVKDATARDWIKSKFSYGADSLTFEIMNP